MRFELHYRNGVKKFDTLEHVQKLTKNIKQPYIVYKYVESKVPEAMEEFEIFGNNGMKELMNDLKRGVTLNDLIKKYHTTYYTISKYIRKYRSEHESLK